LLLKSSRAWAHNLSVGVVLCLAASVAQAQARSKVDFSRLVVVGDSLAAGVQNGSLADFQQVHGFANVIARQLYTRLTLPLVPYPGAPNTLELVSADFPPVIKPVPGTLLFPRLNPFAPVTDVAVPLQTVADALNRRPDNNLNSSDETQAATNLVLGFPCPVLFPCPPHSPAQTQVEQAVARRPSMIVVEIGSNDILHAITSGQLGNLSSPAGQAAFFADFNSNYGKLMDALAGTNAKLVVGNIPDVIQAAYFVRIPALAAAANIPVEQLTMLLGVSADDFLTLDAIPTVEQILTNAQPGPLPATCSGNAPCVVTAAQATLVRLAVQQLNTIIGAQSVLHGGVVVDLFSLIDDIYNNGYQVRNVTLTTDFLGGLFSLDGLHPSNTGYAIIANEFIKGINGAFGTAYRTANIASIADHDPLVLNCPQHRW
jgi:lysophospholipase L1-like esterase